MSERNKTFVKQKKSFDQLKTFWHAPSVFFGEWKKRGTVLFWRGGWEERHTLSSLSSMSPPPTETQPPREDFSTSTYWTRFMGKQNIHFSSLWLFDMNILPAERAAAVRTVRDRAGPWGSGLFGLCWAREVPWINLARHSRWRVSPIY